MSKKNHNRKKHPSRGRLRSRKVTKKIDEAARRANKRVDDAGGIFTGASTPKMHKFLTGKDVENKKNKSVPRPKKKPTPPKVPTIKAKPGKMKRRPTMEEQLEASGVGIDYTQMDGGGLIGGQKKLDANKDGKISGADFEMMGANNKKYGGGKVYKKMGGGKVYKRKHSGKVIKNNMSGQDLVNACYD